jgi:FkbM family methyltransferase
MSETTLPLKVRFFGPVLRRIRPAWLASSLKRVMGIRRVVVRTKAGAFCVDPVSHFGHGLIRDGDYEPRMGEILRHFLPPGGTFMDVGANEGFFSVLAASLVGPSGRVIAVEPQRRLHPWLEENFRLNDLHNVRLVRAAVSDAEGMADLYLSPDVNTGSTGLTRSTRYRVGTEAVRTATLAQLVAEAGVGRIDLMKMDIEGFEYEAILGSEGLFRGGEVRALAVELHPADMLGRGRDPRRIADMLRACGYRKDLSYFHTLWVRNTEDQAQTGSTSSDPSRGR